MGSEPTVPSVTISTRRPVRVDAAAGRVVVRVEGDLDLGTHEPLLDGLARGLALAEDVLVVDLASCHFVSSRSFRAIEDAHDFLHARGAGLVVLEPPPSFAIISAFLGDRCAFRVQRAPHGEVV
jgi:anti-anti-sigma regulatory factor